MLFVLPNFQIVNALGIMQSTKAIAERLSFITLTIGQQLASISTARHSLARSKSSGFYAAAFMPVVTAVSLAGPFGLFSGSCTATPCSLACSVKSFSAVNIFSLTS